MLKLQVV